MAFDGTMWVELSEYNSLEPIIQSKEKLFLLTEEGYTTTYGWFKDMPVIMTYDLDNDYPFGIEFEYDVDAIAFKLRFL